MLESESCYSLKDDIAILSKTLNKVVEGSSKFSLQKSITKPSKLNNSLKSRHSLANIYNPYGNTSSSIEEAYVASP